MFTKDIGIDLGTANTLVHVKGKGIVLREPSVIAVDKNTDEIMAVGMAAKQMIGRTPGSIEAIRPLKGGVIADFDITASMLQYFIQSVAGKGFWSRPRVMVCVPSGVTEVEWRSVHEATLKAGAKEAKVIEEPMAAAIGAGLPISEPTGSMVVDIGGGTTEVAVISLNGIVTAKSVRVAGDAFDDAIVNYIKKKYNLLIGERTAEDVKINIGSAFPVDDSASMDIKGRNLLDGLPKNINITAVEVREALSDSLASILDTVRATFEVTPPELASDIISSGIMLTGGGALLRGLDQLICTDTGIPVRIAERPLDCVAEGTGAALEYYENLSDSRSRRSGGR